MPAYGQGRETNKEVGMQVNKRTVIAAAAAAALAAGGVGVAQAIGGGEEERVTGPDAEQAKAAALDAVGGGTVTEAEYQEAGGSGFYEVEVQRADGSQVEVHLDQELRPVGTVADDDDGPDDDEAGSEEDEAGEDRD
jgi:uncharacterized membrane protein YkoI